MAFLMDDGAIADVPLGYLSKGLLIFQEKRAAVRIYNPIILIIPLNLQLGHLQRDLFLFHVSPHQLVHDSFI